MSPLAHIIARRIGVSGPITMAEYMAECLMHPEHGYYTTRPVFGAKGDFTTAPEISQMFGELLGLSLAHAWQAQGSPKKAILLELGPGRGTLMADMLRALKNVDAFAGCAVHLVESAPALRQLQHEALAPLTPSLIHHDTALNVPQDVPIFAVANEFFDALPVRQFKKEKKGWRECLVSAQDGALVLGWSEPAAAELPTALSANTPQGGIVEYCPALGAIAAHLGALISKNGGAALCIDYGDWRSSGDTVQAVRAHKFTPLLAEPGLADITAHVDFEHLCAAMMGAGTVASNMMPQGVFLKRLGIEMRADILARKMNSVQAGQHYTAMRRLIAPDQMGTLFKVMGFAPKIEWLPAGLDPLRVPPLE